MPKGVPKTRTTKKPEWELITNDKGEIVKKLPKPKPLPRKMGRPVVYTQQVIEELLKQFEVYIERFKKKKFDDEIPNLQDFCLQVGIVPSTLDYLSRTSEEYGGAIEYFREYLLTMEIVYLYNKGIKVKSGLNQNVLLKKLNYLESLSDKRNGVKIDGLTININANASPSEKKEAYYEVMGSAT